MPQPPNLQKMLQQAQEMMAAQQEAQEALKEERVETSAGGGMVKVVATGEGRLESLTLDPDAVDPEDVEMLQDMVMAAVNEALRAVTGNAPALAYELRELEEQVAGGDGPTVVPGLTEEEWVARFVTEFDAEEIVPEAPPEETA